MCFFNQRLPMVDFSGWSATVGAQPSPLMLHCMQPSSQELFCLQANADMAVGIGLQAGRVSTGILKYTEQGHSATHTLPPSITHNTHTYQGRIQEFAKGGTVPPIPFPSPRPLNQLGGPGSAESSASGVQGRAPTESERSKFSIS